MKVHNRPKEGLDKDNGSSSRLTASAPYYPFHNDYDIPGTPDPDAYRRMMVIKNALPARHEDYVRDRITKRGKCRVSKHPKAKGVPRGMR